MFLADFCKTIHNLSGIGLCAPGKHGEGPRAAPDIPQSVSDGKYHSEENEPLFVPYGKLSMKKYVPFTRLITCESVVGNNATQLKLYMSIAGASSEGNQVSPLTLPIAQGDPSPPLRSTCSSGKHQMKKN